MSQESPAQDLHAGPPHHGRLLEILRRIECAIEIVRLARSVAELRRHLLRHFASEETVGGFFEEVESLHPPASQRTRNLRAEHGWLAEETEQLQELLAAHGCGCGEIPAAVKTRVTVLCERLRAHERREQALLIETLDIDLGSAD